MLKDENDAEIDDESSPVDVLTVQKVPVFASDSEEEEGVFHFATKFTNTLGGRGKGGKPGYEDG